MPNKPEDQLPEMPEELRTKLFPAGKPEDQVTAFTPKGKCEIHGEVGFGRFMLIDSGELISDHCVRCLSRVFTALVGVLEVPEDEE